MSVHLCSSDVFMSELRPEINPDVAIMKDMLNNNYFDYSGRTINKKTNKSESTGDQPRHLDRERSEW